jgi:hypothetical protein
MEIKFNILKITFDIYNNQFNINESIYIFWTLEHQKFEENFGPYDSIIPL